LMLILFIVISSLSTISESVFVAYRSSKYIFVKSIFFSISKIIFPFILIALGAYGIFMSVGLSLIIAFALSLIILIFKYNYLIYPIIDKKVIKRIFKFSLGNYFAGFVGGLPLMVFPIMITNYLGPKFTAYYYMPMMIAGFLYIIPQATTRSLFAEGSYSEGNVRIFVNKSLILNILLLLPGMMVVYLFGKYILLIFGFEYAKEGTQFLQLLAISGTFVYINSVGGVLLNIKHEMNKLIIISSISTFLILSLSYFFISEELLGLGIAWIIGNVITSVLYLVISYRS
jgi:O-antigen/teichoic acid export membrane protein